MLTSYSTVMQPSTTENRRSPPQTSTSSSNTLPFATLSSPAAFSSIPPKTVAALRAHRANFFNSSVTHQHASDRRRYPPLTSSPSPSSSTSSTTPQDLFRTRFRRACQAHMARDRARTIARVRGVDLSHVHGPLSDGDRLRLRGGLGGGYRRAPHVGSDELARLASDDEDEEDASVGDGRRDKAARSHWAEEDEELMRHIMLSEYRRAVRLQESEGRRMLDWLDADEVDYLEAELQREDAERHHGHHLLETTPRPRSRGEVRRADDVDGPRTPVRLDVKSNTHLTPQDIEDAELEFYADLYAQQQQQQQQCQQQQQQQHSQDPAEGIMTDSDAVVSQSQSQEDALETILMIDELDRVEELVSASASASVSGVVDVDMG